MKPDATPPQAPMILVVDDFEDNRQMYAEFLQFWGFVVVEASNGVEAIEQANKCMPDIVVMDLSLPVLDGWEATRRLKDDPRTRHIPVVALTGHALDGHPDGAREAGCDGFLAKPCLPEKLLETVMSMLRNVRSGARA
ncbi:MAG: response regulator [Polyangiaceae bacterium]|jgi:CheY-like chemotaxis protein